MIMIVIIVNRSDAHPPVLVCLLVLSSLISGLFRLPDYVYIYIYIYEYVVYYFE